MNKVTHGDRLWVFTAVNFTRADISNEKKSFVHMHVQHVHIDISHSITLNVSLKTHTDIEKTKENAKTKTKCFEWKRDSDNQHCSVHVILFLSLYSILFFSPLLLLLLLVDVRCTQSTVCMCVWMDGWMDVCVRHWYQCMEYNINKSHSSEPANMSIRVEQSNRMNRAHTEYSVVNRVLYLHWELVTIFFT